MNGFGHFVKRLLKGENEIEKEVLLRIENNFIGKQKQDYKIRKQSDLLPIFEPCEKDNEFDLQVKQRLRELRNEFFQKKNYALWIKNGYKGDDNCRLWILINYEGIMSRLTEYRAKPLKDLRNYSNCDTKQMISGILNEWIK